MNKESQRLLKLCKTEDFEIEEALKLISSLDVNKPVVDLSSSWKAETTFLSEATTNTNLKMVRLLLQNGANPNMIFEDENPFWDLQYNDYCDSMYEEDEETARTSDEKRLQMAQLMLEYGADPCIVVENEDLFSYVLYSVFNDDPGHLWEYRSRFFVLLVAYGGKNKYCKPEIIKPFDKSNMLQYKFFYVTAGDGYHLTGEIVDENCEVVAKV